jgi:two-component sensor histidine kinase
MVPSDIVGILVTRPLDQAEVARASAQTVMETVREPVLVLDGEFKIVSASGSFFRSFKIDPENTLGQNLFGLDSGAWNVPALHQLLERIIPAHSVMEDFEISHAFPRIGHRTFLLHARRAFNDNDERMTIVIGFEDVTDRRAIEHEKEVLRKRADSLLLQKEMLLAEMQHRVVNSLQIIASILMLKARAVTSDETRLHLQDAHRRVMSVATVQQHLHSSGIDEKIEIGPYLTKLCASLAESMIGESRPALLQVVADKGAMASADIVSLGLIVTELVINCLKYAFPEHEKSAAVTVCYETNDTGWKLSVSDNGVGRTDAGGVSGRGGLGTSLVNALANQLDATVSSTTSTSGLSVSIVHTASVSQVPEAA